MHIEMDTLQESVVRKYRSFGILGQRLILGTAISLAPSVITGSYTICLSTSLALGLTGLAESKFNLQGRRIYIEGVAAFAIGAVVSKYLDGKSNMIFSGLLAAGSTAAADVAQRYLEPASNQPHKWAREDVYTDEKGRHISQIDQNGLEYHREDVKDGTTTSTGYVVDSIWALKTGVAPDGDGKYTHTSVYDILPDEMPKPLTSNILI